MLTPALSLAEMIGSNGEVLHPTDKMTTTTQNSVDIPCIKSNITKREDTIKSAFAAFTVAMNTALDTRKAGLEESFTKTTAKERAVARKSVRTAFRIASVNAHKDLSVARQNAWIAFKKEAKSCKGGTVEIKDEMPSNARSSTEAL